MDAAWRAGRRKRFAASGGAESATRNRLKRQKPSPEETLPEKRDLTLPESPLVTQLHRLEALVDEHLARRRATLREVMDNRECPTATLRLLLYHDFPRPHVASSGEVEPPHWVFRLGGVVLGKDSEEPLPGPDAQRYRFAHFFHRVVIHLEGAGYEGLASTIEVRRWQLPAVAGGLEVRRRSRGPCRVRVALWRDYYPVPRFKTSKELSDVLGRTVVESRQCITAHFWQYLVEHRRLSRDFRDEIVLDERLRALFGRKRRVLVQDLPALLEPHMLPPDPIVFEHLIPDAPRRATAPAAPSVSPSPKAAAASMPRSTSAARRRESGASDAGAEKHGAKGAQGDATRREGVAKEEKEGRQEQVQVAAGEEEEEGENEEEEEEEEEEREEEEEVDAYDIVVELPPTQMEMSLTLPVAASQVAPRVQMPQMATESLSYGMAEAHQLVSRALRRRELLVAFAEDPTDTMELILSSDVAKAREAAGEGAGDDERATEHYSSEWVGEAIDRYLAKLAPRPPSGLSAGREMEDEEDDEEEEQEEDAEAAAADEAEEKGAREEDAGDKEKATGEKEPAATQQAEADAKGAPAQHPSVAN